MSGLARLSGVVAYIPVIGWLYVYIFRRQDKLAMYHFRQSVGLILFLLGSLLVWLVIAWGLVWIPFMGAMSAALFAVVIVAFLFGAVVWVMGVINALVGRMVPLPGIGRRAERLFDFRR